MTSIRKTSLLILALLSLVIGFGLTTASASTASAKTASTKATSAKTTTLNWRKPSQKKAYPNLKRYKSAWIYVSKKRQRVYFHSSTNAKTDRILYVMYCSTGRAGAATPSGTYHIQKERGPVFMGPLGGARYYVSWKGHGVYLFHSVPINTRGAYIPSAGAMLGHRASHGCIRLTVADAYWLYKHVPFGMKVVIR